MPLVQGSVWLLVLGLDILFGNPRGWSHLGSSERELFG